MLLRGNTRKKESGILLALSCLPGRYGIGSLGECAYRFIDFLKNSGQRYWQLLPLVPLGERNSPYKSESCFAGEILYIDIDKLVADGLLNDDDLPEHCSGEHTDYATAARYKLPLLEKAVENFPHKNTVFAAFVKENDWWLNDYATFAAALDETPDRRIKSMDEGIRLRNTKALEEFCRSRKERIRFYKITQFLFYSQYFELKKYAANCGIKLIGDIPFYISPDSADVWENPSLFKLGQDLTPIQVAGVPPDRFAADGQLWGNPIYDWDAHRKNNFLWWKMRLRHCKKMYDVIRIDHFRAFASYYTIPYGATDARFGRWEKGVGIQFWNSMRDTVSPADIIAEDLGGEGSDVRRLIADTHFADMKVFQFAFGESPEMQHFPKNYEYNCVCYTGTHDNNTTLGWYRSLPDSEKSNILRVLPCGVSTSPVYRMISMLMRSKSRLVIIPMQDYLLLDSSARMNTPGTLHHNWEWRMEKSAPDKKIIDIIRALSKGRN